MYLSAINLPRTDCVQSQLKPQKHSHVLLQMYLTPASYTPKMKQENK